MQPKFHPAVKKYINPIFEKPIAIFFYIHRNLRETLKWNSKKQQQRCTGIKKVKILKSQFIYCRLVWMFHGTQINDKTNKLHKKTLRIVYNDTIMSLK